MGSGAQSLGGGVFSVREIEYLQSLPAVKHVVNGRIIYGRSFKRECVRRYRNGESPSAIFRDAGLDPDLIGSKRIERCIARWKRSFPDDGDDTAKEGAGSVPNASSSSADASGAGSSYATAIAFARSAPESLRDVYLGGSAYPSLTPHVAIFDDISQIVIAQQARRIHELELEVERLQRDNRRQRYGAGRS